MTNNPKAAIRLTNRTARALRAQAKAQRTARYALATVVSIALCAVAVIVGIQHLVAVPLGVLAAIALDAVIILLAKGRYLSLTGQAICTEAAARQMRDETAQAQRVKTAARDLEKIKEDRKKTLILACVGTVVAALAIAGFMIYLSVSGQL